MTTYNTSELKKGLKLMIDNDPFVILEHDHVKPGKGQAFHRLKIRNLKTGRVIDRTYKSGESLEGADVSDIEVQYLYNDGSHWHFMNPESFEQYTADEIMVGEAKQWLTEQAICMLTLWNGSPLTLLPPPFVVMRIVETDPGLKGDTSGGGGKPATLESGAVVRVPLFVQIGELIRVDTEKGEYVSRIKE